MPFEAQPLLAAWENDVLTFIVIVVMCDDDFCVCV